MNFFAWLWAEFTQEKVFGGLKGSVIQEDKGWISGYGEVVTRTDLRLLSRVLEQKKAV